MSFLDRFRKKHPERTPQQLAENAQRLSETAVSYAKQCQRDLDYSEKTLPALEALLEDLSQDIPKSHPTERQIWSMALIFGSYLGEVMLRNGLAAKGYAWATDGDSDVPLLMAPDGSFTTPNDKVYKRLTQGPADNVVSFCQLILDQER